MFRTMDFTEKEWDLLTATMEVKYNELELADIGEPIKRVYASIITKLSRA
jgi:hypothetical protein